MLTLGTGVINNTHTPPPHFYTMYKPCMAISEIREGNIRGMARESYCNISPLCKSKRSNCSSEPVCVGVENAQRV